MRDEKRAFTAVDLADYKRTFLRHWATKLLECAAREDILEVQVSGSRKRDLRPMYGQYHEIIGFKQDGPEEITLVIRDYAKAGKSLDINDDSNDFPQSVLDSDIEGR